VFFPPREKSGARSLPADQLVQAMFGDGLKAHVIETWMPRMEYAL
jgi:hypothetical protein